MPKISVGRSRFLLGRGGRQEPRPSLLRSTSRPSPALRYTDGCLTLALGGPGIVSGDLLKITRRTHLASPVDEASSSHSSQLRRPDFIRRSSSLHDRIHDLRGAQVGSPPRSQTTPDSIPWINTSPPITHQVGGGNESRRSPAAHSQSPSSQSEDVTTDDLARARNQGAPAANTRFA